MSRRETDEGKLKAKFQKKKEEEDELANNLFDQLDEIKGKEDEDTAEAQVKALATYKDLFVDEELVITVKDVKFTFRKNPTILEYEDMQSVKEDDPDRRKKLLEYSYNLLISPEMPFEDYIKLPPYVIKYLEQKISEHFLMGLVSIILED